MIHNENLCYNCFCEKVQKGVCPYCGYDNHENREKYPTACKEGSILNGQYIVGRVLGQGGFGITYIALDYQLNIKVAIKEYLPDGMATRLPGTTLISVYAGEKQDNFNYGAECFLDEARVLAKFIGNRNIVGVRSYFKENNTSYFVMDYIEGISFKSYIKNHGGKIEYHDAIRILIPVMDALALVHKEGFIHRDVTPDNIYITKDNEVKLLDFGSARYSMGDKSKSLDVILKSGYAPKEQYIRRGKQGPYTDIYSLAACFYASISGYLPPEALERMEDDEIVEISTRGIKLPKQMENAIMKGLEVRAEDRFQRVEEFKAALLEMAEVSPAMVILELIEPIEKPDQQIVIEKPIQNANVLAKEPGKPESDLVTSGSKNNEQEIQYHINNSDFVNYKVNLNYKKERIKKPALNWILVINYFIMIVPMLFGFILSFILYMNPNACSEITVYMPFQCLIILILYIILPVRMKKLNVDFENTLKHMFNVVSAELIASALFGGLFLLDYYYFRNSSAYNGGMLIDRCDFHFVFFTMLSLSLSVIPILFYYNIISYKVIRNRAASGEENRSIFTRKKVLLVNVLAIVIFTVSLISGFLSDNEYLDNTSEFVNSTEFSNEIDTSGETVEPSNDTIGSRDILNNISNDEGSNGSDSEETDTTNNADNETQKTITIQAISDDPMLSIIKKAIEEAYPNVTVELVTRAEANYAYFIKKNMEADHQGDLFLVSLEEENELSVPNLSSISDVFADLSDLPNLQDFAELDQTYYKLISYNGKQCAIPCSISWGYAVADGTENTELCKQILNTLYGSDFRNIVMSNIFDGIFAEKDNTVQYVSGNTSGNISCGGMVVQQGDWIYTSVVCKDDGIYKMKTDGSKKKKLSSKYSLSMAISDDWLYYYVPMGDALYKMKTDGSHITRLDKGDTYFYLNVVDDWIYYGNSLSGMYRLSTDGSHKTKIVSDEVYGVTVLNGWIYYICDKSISKIPIDGNENISISTDEALCLNVVDGWIYYVNYSDNDSLYKIKIDGTHKTRLNIDCDITDVNVAGNWIFIRDQDNIFYKMKTDGSDLTNLGYYNEFLLTVNNELFIPADLR